MLHKESAGPLSCCHGFQRLLILTWTGWTSAVSQAGFTLNVSLAGMGLRPVRREGCTKAIFLASRVPRSAKVTQASCLIWRLGPNKYIDEPYMRPRMPVILGE